MPEVAPAEEAPGGQEQQPEPQPEGAKLQEPSGWSFGLRLTVVLCRDELTSACWF